LLFNGSTDALVTNSIDFSTGATNPPLGPELVTNGTFDTNTNDWSAGTGAFASTISVDTQRLKVTNTSIAFGIGYQTLTTVAGKWYEASCDFTLGTATSGALQAGTTIGGFNLGVETSTTTRKLKFQFLATGTTTYLSAANNNNSGAHNFYDNITLREFDANYLPDRMSVFAGVRKLSSSLAFTPVVELSTSWVSNAGTFALWSQTSTAQVYESGSRGNAGAVAGQNASSAVFAAPVTNVVTATHDIRGDLSALRVNGAANGANGTADKGTGNFGNYPLYIGRRNNASLQWNGRIYSLIVRGAQSTETQIANTETWVNGKTKAYNPSTIPGFDSGFDSGFGS
jgi:hypothetical protein